MANKETQVFGNSLEILEMQNLIENLKTAESGLLLSETQVW